MTLTQELLISGWALVPMPVGSKGPTHSGWNTRERCITNSEQCHKLTGANVGLAHAYCTPNPTCAIDIDNYKQAKAWLATHDLDLNLLLLAPGAVVIWSGKEFSLKLIYRLPPGVPPVESKKINGNDGKSALEFRCATKDGRTVQDLLPPSIHPDGHEYQWIGQGNPLHLLEIPPAVLALWQLLVTNGCRVSNRKFSGVSIANYRLESPRQIATIKNALQHISADCHYELWRNIVWAVLSTRWSCAEVIAESWSKAAVNRYKDDSFWLLVNSYMPDHPTPISVGTIYHHARNGGWNG